MKAMLTTCAFWSIAIFVLLLTELLEGEQNNKVHYAWVIPRSIPSFTRSSNYIEFKHSDKWKHAPGCLPNLKLLQVTLK